MKKRAAATAPSEIGAGEFKAKCLELMDSVAETGAAITITKRGVPVARLVQARPPTASLFGCLRGTFEEQGDIVRPLDVAWETRPERVALLASD